MLAIKGSWAGKSFAVAASNDSGGRKPRIRRSKEERKAMVESFIRKYQKSNDGNFPSIYLTHKEVGGSFYTVRELLREAIQENRVLGPPKVSSEEHGHSEFLEQQPLGSISVEPQVDLSVSDGAHIAADVMPNEYQITSEETFSSSSLQFNGSYPLELNEEITDGVSRVTEKDEVSDETSKRYHATEQYEDRSIKEVLNYAEQLPQSKSEESKDEKIVTGVEVLEKNANSDSPVIANVDHKDNNDSAIEPSQKLNGLASQRLSSEQHNNENDHMVDIIKEFGERVSMESAVMEILDKGKHGAQVVEESQAVKPYISSDVAVEKFPLRPLIRSIHDMDGESGKPHLAAGTLKDKVIQPDKRTFTQSSSDLVNAHNKEKLPESTVGLNGEHRDENMVLNLQSPSLDSAKSSSASEPSMLDASNSTELLSSKGPTAVGQKSSDQDHGSLAKGNNPNKLDLETSEGASKNSTQPETNALTALVKAFISSFIKFWSE